jgi:hypothetical protein
MGLLAGGEVTAALAKLHALPKIGSPGNFATFLAGNVPNWAGAVKIFGTMTIEWQCAG